MSRIFHLCIQLVRWTVKLAPCHALCTCISGGHFAHSTVTEQCGKVQQVYYDHSMRGGYLTFDQKDPGDDTLTERENKRRHNWVLREGHPTTLKAELAAVWDQNGRLPVNREVE